MEDIWRCVFFFCYMAVATTFIPLPTQPVAIGMGEFFAPWIVALLGATSASSSHFIEYQIVTRLFDRGKLSWLQRIPKLKEVQKRVKNHLILGLFFSAATGLIPSDLVRLFSMMVRFNPFIASVAIFFGRIPRYYFLAYVGMKLQIPLPYLFLFFVVLLLMALLHVVRLKRIKREKEEPIL